jgi:hypothetical protein
MRPFVKIILYFSSVPKNAIFSLFFLFDCAIFETDLMKLVLTLDVSKSERDLRERAR